MYLQGVNRVWEIDWDGRQTYGDILLRQEIEYCEYNFNTADVDGLVELYNFYEEECNRALERGLVVPVVRGADRLSMAQIEGAIAELAGKAQDRTLQLEDLQGAVFTISNGGVFGSMLSTPILNPPQSAVLGMHKIQERPVAEGGEVVIRPMMYLALSYDHRIIDGRDAVQFLVAVKEALEDPARLLLAV